MEKKLLIFSVSMLSIISSVVFLPSAFAAKVGVAAPAFSTVDTTGKPISLNQFKGQFVVLEWHNKDCPYVKAQYGSGNMQKTQKKWTDKGVKWITIVSSAQGKEGFVDSAAAAADIEESKSHITTMIEDATGKIGHAYGALTTPHLFIIDPKGTLIYNGAIDNHPSYSASEVNPQASGYINYVDKALTAATAGQKVTDATSKPYGCSVKY